MNNFHLSFFIEDFFAINSLVNRNCFYFLDSEHTSTIVKPTTSTLMNTPTSTVSTPSTPTLNTTDVMNITTSIIIPNGKVIYKQGYFKTFSDRKSYFE